EGRVMIRPSSPLTMLLHRLTGGREFITLLGSAVAAWPLAASAQQQPLPVIGFLHQVSPEPLSLMNAFRKGLSEAGIIDIQDVTIEDRAADGHYNRLPALAAELVEHRVAVIAANFLPAALAAKAATQTIPIVFLSGSDPIGAGLVSSINRPTENVTGIAPMPCWAQRIWNSCTSLYPRPL